jgi:hypothetical protein
LAGFHSWVAFFCFPVLSATVPLVYFLYFGNGFFGERKTGLGSPVKGFDPHAFLRARIFDYLFSAWVICDHARAGLYCPSSSDTNFGGGIIILMGLSLSGLLTPKWLMMEKKWEYRQTKVGYGGSVLVGISFAAGWTPCIGPILASVLVMSANQPSAGLALILGGNNGLMPLSFLGQF